MKLFTKPITEQLLKNGTGEARGQDHFPVVKLFTPDANATWLLIDIDPTDPDLAFGLCDIGHPELGYVRVSELQSIRGQLGLPIERDRHFKAQFPLSVYTEAARSAGRITTSKDHLLTAQTNLKHRQEE